jgi:hypothetical protein
MSTISSITTNDNNDNNNSQCTIYSKLTQGFLIAFMFIFSISIIVLLFLLNNSDNKSPKSPVTAKASTVVNDPVGLANTYKAFFSNKN